MKNLKLVDEQLGVDISISLSVVGEEYVIDRLALMGGHWRITSTRTRNPAEAEGRYRQMSTRYMDDYREMLKRRALKRVAA